MPRVDPELVESDTVQPAKKNYWTTSFRDFLTRRTEASWTMWARHTALSEWDSQLVKSATVHPYKKHISTLLDESSLNGIPVSLHWHSPSRRVLIKRLYSYCAIFLFLLFHICSMTPDRASMKFWAGGNMSTLTQCFDYVHCRVRDAWVWVCGENRMIEFKRIVSRRKKQMQRKSL